MSIALAALLLLPGLGAAPFDDPGEGQHAEIAREMVATGDWLHLRLNGVPYFDKPPLLYWMAAMSFRLYGVHEWAARLAPFIGTALAVAATAVLGARVLGPAGGLFAAAALLSSGLFVAFGRYVRPETLFVAAIQWGLTGLLLGLGESPRRRVWALVGCAALAAAAEIKDVLGLFAPLLAIGLTLALAGRLRPFARWLPPAGVAVLIVIGAAWYLIALRQPGFLWYTVVDNHLLNVMRLRRFPDEDVPLSALEFLGVSTMGAVPWIVPAALAAGSMVVRRAWRNPAETAWTALAVWTVAVLAFFSLVPFRLPHYALAAYPAVALLAARGWQEEPARRRGLIVAHLALFALLAGVCAAAAGSDGRLFTDTVLSATDVYTRKEAALGQAGSLPPWPELAALLRACALAFASASAVLLGLLVRRAHALGRWVVLATMLSVMPAVTAAVSKVSASRAVRGLAAELRHELGPGDVLVHEGPIENSGALELYSGRRPFLLDARRSVLGFAATFPETSATFWDSARFRAEWCSGRRIVLVTPRDPANSIVARLPPASLRLLLDQNGRRVYSSTGNRAALARC